MLLRNRCERGSATIVLAALVPLFICLFALVLNVGRLALRTTRLEIAADRAAAAGAASLAYDLNRIAKLNREMADRYRAVKEDFEKDSEAPGGGDEELKQANLFQADRIDRIREIEGAIFTRARAHAEEVFHANVPDGTIAFPRVDGHSFVDCFQDPSTGELLREHVRFDEVAGGVIFDPVTEQEEAGGGDLVRACAKDPAAFVMIGTRVETTVEPVLLPNFFEDSTIEASSAAAPFGGSIRGFAETTDDDRSGVEETSEDLYRSALIPETVLGEVEWE